MSKIMKKFIWIVIFIFCFSLLVFDCAYAKVHPKAGTTGATFLKIGVGARPISMGDAFVAVADDANTIYWNPAGLSNISRPEITAMHNQWFEGINYEFLGYVHPTKKWGNFGVGLSLLHMDRISRTREDEQGLYAGKEGTFEVSNRSFILAYARKITDDISGGFNFKIIHQINADIKSQGLAFDLGCLYKTFVNNLIVGFNIQNIGYPVKMGEETFHLPMNIRIGFSYKPIQSLTIATDLKQPLDNYLNISLGGEYTFKDIFALRIGYKYELGDNDLGSLSGLRAGCGFKWQSFQVDYAIAPYGNLGNTHRISLLVRL